MSIGTSANRSTLPSLAEEISAKFWDWRKETLYLRHETLAVATDLSREEVFMGYASKNEDDADAIERAEQQKQYEREDREEAREKREEKEKDEKK